ncbi:hypothetical protein BN946_scf184766.g29 [Trametes cinnabarina]|uniref:Uncharacterized protein n=1 Tax=Pycnoporus cinnabarinus TaxID=5643 RepID=A0A060SC00_PYCCI|nr:hypothetical protein BN946_scf184766.g29 [Trametes cinnabarina]
MPGFNGLQRIRKTGAAVSVPLQCQTSSPVSRLASLSPSLSPPPPSQAASKHRKQTSVKHKKVKVVENDEDNSDEFARLPKKQKTAHLVTTEETQETPDIIRRYEMLLTSTKMITRITNGIEYLYQAARTLPRHVGVCVNYTYVLTEGLHREGEWTQDELELQDLTWSPWWEAFVYFDGISRHFPGLSDNIMELRQRPELVGHLARWMSSVAGKARGDDISRLKDKVVSLADLSDTSGLKAKSSRGFKHPETGRLLCPIKRLGEYDADPEKSEPQPFCRMVRDQKAGHARVRSADYPLFMYNMNEYVPGKLIPGFLKSTFLVDCTRVVFTGPSSTSGLDMSSKTKGKPPVCRALNMMSINFINIVYIAILARFCLNSQSDYQDRDIDFSNKDFMSNLMTISLKSEKWHEEICSWYTRQLFQRCSEDSDGDEGSGPSAHELLLAELAEEQEFENQNQKAPRAEAEKDSALADDNISEGHGEQNIGHGSLSRCDEDQDAEGSKSDEEVD